MNARMGVGPRTRRYALVLVVAVLLLVANTWLLGTLGVIGIPMTYLLALFGQLVLLIVVVFSLVLVLRTPARIVASIAGSALAGARQDPYVVGARVRYPRVCAWIDRRLARDSPGGLVLTVGTLTAGAALLGSLSLVSEVATNPVFAAVDQRVVNLMPHLRTPGQDAFFGFLSSTADGVSVVLALVVLTVLTWRRAGLRWVPVLLTTAFLTKVVVSTVVQHLIDRPRPDRTLALVTETGPSFPSGHTLTATVVGGLITYLLFRAARHPVLKLMVILMGIPVIVLIGISRIYLGAHYPSDVLGGLVLGAVLLAVFVTAAEIDHRHHLTGRVHLDPATVRPVLAAVFVAAVFAAFFGARLTPLQAVDPTVSPTALPGIDATTVQQLPRYSETLTGASMEPINCVYLGTEVQLEDRFTRAGWYRAEPSTPATTLQAVLVALRNEPYPTAPVTPAYLDSRPETVAFEQPTDANTLVQRHHTRLWRTDYVVDGVPVWVATASFDQGVGLGTAIALPTHHIDPDVDAERAHILGSLGIQDPQMLQVVEPQLGHNASGEAFFTDGKAAVVDLGATAR